MNITIHIDSEVPLFVQCMDQIKMAIKSGYLKPGDSLPSIRQLANDLDLNNKTVAKAYKMLERDNLIVSRGYRGSFIHSEALDNVDRDISSDIYDILRQSLSQCKEMGATDSEIRNIFTDLMQNHIAQNYKG